jgi:hypothetical protein
MIPALQFPLLVSAFHPLPGMLKREERGSLKRLEPSLRMSPSQANKLRKDHQWF